MSHFIIAGNADQPDRYGDGDAVLLGIIGRPPTIPGTGPENLDERVYALHDANFNITALQADSGGFVWQSDPAQSRRCLRTVDRADI